MKSKQLLSSAALAFAVTALFASSAKAAGGVNDLYLGFSDASSTNDYLVDLGTIASFTTTSTFSINLNADLGSSSEFGSNYYTGDTSLTFGLGGQTGTTASPSGLLVSEDATSAAINPYTGLGSGGTTNSGQQIQIMVAGFNNAAAAGTASNPTFGVFSSNVNNAVIQPASENSTAGHSYATENPTVNAWGTGYNVTTLVNGGTLDLFKLPKSFGGAGTLLGTATVSSDGVFTFTGSAVPEPSTYGLMALGLGLVAFLRRRLAA